MVSYENFYAGADYGLDSDYGESFLGFGYRFPTEQFGIPTDPRTANQIKAVSDKLSTGAKTIEVSGVTPQVLENIPKQHLKEINRLKKLTGVNLTFHGPLIEPTGVGRDNWTEEQREFAERQMWSALERSHELEPDGNIVVTFHTSNGLPEPRTRVKTKDGKIISTGLAVIDERTGRFGAMPKPKEEHFLGRKASVDEELKRLNEENWARSLGNLNFIVNRGRNAIRETINDLERKQRMQELPVELKEKNVMELYNLSKTSEGQKFIENLNPNSQKFAQEIINNIDYGAVAVREAYSDLQQLFDQAYDAALGSDRKVDIMKLDEYQKEVSKKLEKWKTDPTKVAELADEITRGVRVLDSIQSPQVFQPLEKFANDKAAETFSNLALQGYKKFKDTAPIISIENPPAGMGITRAEDIRKLIDTTRDKFVKKAKEELGMSGSEARKQSEKLIGVTWDIGHINMIRKFGYDESDIVKETEKIAPYVKHVHLSDNFGMEHTELPMGMGNVPTKKMLDLISKYNKQVKKIAETGTWFGPQAFGTQTPFRQTLEAFGSPVFSMQAPYWNQAAATTGEYSVGFGRVLPDVHFSTYGAGFSNLPTELGGQMGGRNRLSGAPME
ncbi:MAG: hypothetical protein IIA87_01625 [Nanoarchaeota archaeon]|nr:hypothetical protein [Nanoarchaeota archaeon]